MIWFDMLGCVRFGNELEWNVMVPFQWNGMVPFLRSVGTKNGMEWFYPVFGWVNRRTEHIAITLLNILLI